MMIHFQSFLNNLYQKDRKKKPVLWEIITLIPLHIGIVQVILQNLMLQEKLKAYLLITITMKAKNTKIQLAIH